MTVKLKHWLVVASLGLLCAVQAEAQTATKFLADRHVAKGINCMMCHDDVKKGTIKLNEKKHEACTQCHGWYDQVAKKTVPVEKDDQNPHSQHDGNLPCTECHKGHKPGVNYCGGCHMWGFKVP